MRIILTLLIAVISLFGQGGNTQYQALALGIDPTTLPKTFAVTPQNNVGQSNHGLIFNFRNNPPFTCPSTTGIVASLDGSIDNSVFNRIFVVVGSFSNVTGGTSQLKFKRTGVAAYPFLRASVNTFSTLCLLDLYYVGTLFPEAIPNNSGNFGLSSYDNAFLAGTGQIIQGVTGGNIESTGNPLKVAIYGLQFQDTIVGVGATVTYFLGVAGNGITCNGSETYDVTLFQFVVPAGTSTTFNYILPNSAIPYFKSDTTNVGFNQICIKGIGTQTNHNPTINLVYRYE